MSGYLEMCKRALEVCLVGAVAQGGIAPYMSATAGFKVPMVGAAK